MIPLTELNHGFLYKIKGRCGNIGIWDSSIQRFLVRSFSFGKFYIEQERHWDAHETYGTAKPLEEIEKAPFENLENLEYIHSFEVEKPILEYLEKMEKLNGNL